MTKRIQILGGFPKSDWNQTDETKTDYIKNKPVALLDELSSRATALETKVGEGFVEVTSQEIQALFTET